MDFGAWVDGAENALIPRKKAYKTQSLTGAVGNRIDNVKQVGVWTIRCSGKPRRAANGMSRRSIDEKDRWRSLERRRRRKRETEGEKT